VSVTLPGNLRGTLRWPSGGYALSAFDAQGPVGPVSASLDNDDVVVPLTPGTTAVRV
jgi:hypothetical protein